MHLLRGLRVTGRQLGFISLLASAATYSGVESDGSMATQKEWGLQKGDGAAHPSTSSLHVRAWKLGAWPLRPLSTLSAMHYLFTFGTQLPSDRGSQPVRSSFDGTAPSGPRRRRGNDELK